MAAGSAKLAGVEMMVATCETIGIGQWFRYLTGAIEVGSAILLFGPGKQAWGAALQVCTMIGPCSPIFSYSVRVPFPLWYWVCCRQPSYLPIVINYQGPARTP